VSVSLPSGHELLQKLSNAGARDALLLCLDYDGTLAPFPKGPTDRLLPEKTRRTLERLADQCAIAVVTGRQASNARDLIGLDALIYAGNHGLEIEGPPANPLRHMMGEEHSASVAEVGAEVTARIADIEGAFVNVKNLCFSIHYPNPGDHGRLKEIALDVMTEFEGLRLIEPGKHMEVRPDVDWDKGSAVHWIADAVLPGGVEQTVVFIGDDLADEYGFIAAKDKGHGILVAETPRQTAASHGLNNHLDVGEFLAALCELLESPG
jgi:trehalose-phosphatase